MFQQENALAPDPAPDAALAPDPAPDAAPAPDVDPAPDPAAVAARSAGAGGAPSRVVLVGSGSQAYRAYALADAAARAELALVGPHAPTWQIPYLADHARVTGPAPETLADAVRRVTVGEEGHVGVLTWDEVALEATAAVAERLGAPHMSPQAARNCRDKLATRRLMREAGLPAVRFAHVRGLDEALRAAEEIGYPVVVKPRALAGSVGVVVARDAEDLLRVHRHAADSDFPGLDRLDGLVLEEFLAGPEISVDSVVRGGVVRPVNVARKRLGFDPFFEEVGHLVAPWRHEPWADDLVDLVVRTHQALGVTTGVTHAEVRLTAAGPRLVELNGRMGGDLIPWLGKLATGIDLTAAAVDLALGVEPDLLPIRDLCAEVRFLYPEEDSVFRSLDAAAAEAVPGVVRVLAVADPGEELLLPPRGVVPRTAAVVVTGEDPEACRTALDAACPLVRVETESLLATVAG